MKKSSSVERLAQVALVAVSAYGAYVLVTWLRFGHPTQPKGEEADPLLDRFMPEYEVVERRSCHIYAPAEIVMSTAYGIRFEDSPLVHRIFQARERLLGSRVERRKLRAGLMEQVKAIGWGVLAEHPGREVVMGAVTQPWNADVVFHPILPQDFAAFQDPEFVKIAWTLRADPINARECIFRTETRVMTGGAAPRSKFRKYWAFLSPGIKLVRLALLWPLKQEAERRAKNVA